MPARAAAPGFSFPADCRVVDLLSDVHLEAGMPRTFDALRQHLTQTPADAVLILGDLFEVWVGDDARQEGFEAEATAMLREAARHKRLAFMPGNRDFLIGQDWLHDTGVGLLPDPMVWTHGTVQALLSHGDALCLADTTYLAFRAEVRTAEWQSRFLAHPLGERRSMARAMRDASQAHHRGSPAAWADVDNDAAAQWLADVDQTQLVHGHTHRPGKTAIGNGLLRWTLGDWDFDHGPGRGQLLRSDGHALTWVQAQAA
ncbi:MAG: UDP-2,3-diacylglucosamine diphosphatase [Aquabacterium sp.]